MFNLLQKKKENGGKYIKKMYKICKSNLNETYSERKES